ncbi:hypothetical protein L6Q79_13140 [bacterium]|nr:hypothetical protein [bacterium]NUN46662.1 hypothetical protein [bacterium]
MKSFMLTWFVALALSLSAVNGQDNGVAFLSSIKGTIKVTDASGKEKKASPSLKLLAGDKITASANSSVSVMYYSGKEVVLKAGQNHVITAVKTEDSFLSGLYKSLSGMLWGEASNSSMAGATRAWAGDANRNITAVYPSESKVINDSPVFEWADHRATPGNDYVITISSEISDFKYEMTIKGSKQAAYPKTAPKLKSDEKYQWSIKDATGAEVSPTAKFSLLAPEDKETLEDDIKEVAKVCNNDNTNPQWYLLSAALYRDYGLMKEAETAIKALIAMKPDMVQAHVMLATLYKETGRLEEAKAAEEQARKLSEGKK